MFTHITHELTTAKALKKAIRDLEKMDTLHIVGWGQVKKIGTGAGLAICDEVDDSDPYRDYSAWTYGWRAKWITDEIIRKYNLQ